jgi:hypothetical protein
MVAKMETDSTIINLETSFPMDRAWKVHRFLMQIADEKIEPIDAFKKAFKENK